MFYVVIFCPFSGFDLISSAIAKIESEQHSSWPAQMCDGYDSFIWLCCQNGTVLLQVPLFTKQLEHVKERVLYVGSDYEQRVGRVRE